MPGLPVAGPPVDGVARVGFEDEDYAGYRWWPVAEVLDSNERFYPGTLPRLLEEFLRGVQIDEPFEYWS